MRLRKKKGEKEGQKDSKGKQPEAKGLEDHHMKKNTYAERYRRVERRLQRRVPAADLQGEERYGGASRLFP